MSDDWDAALCACKARERLSGAESEFSNERYTNAANRAYYAAFQAAIAALLTEGIHARDGRWAHTFAQAAYVGKLINRRRRYSPELRETLSQLLRLRHNADYRGAPTRKADAAQAIRRSRDFVEAIRPESKQE